MSDYYRRFLRYHVLRNIVISCFFGEKLGSINIFQIVTFRFFKPTNEPNRAYLESLKN